MTVLQSLIARYKGLIANPRPTMSTHNLDEVSIWPYLLSALLNDLEVLAGKAEKGKTTR